MAVRGHVISCDLCGLLMAMPTAMKHAERRSREELVRVYAAGWGWRQLDDGDRCPYHEVEVEQSSLSRFSHHLSGLRNRLSLVGEQVLHARQEVAKRLSVFRGSDSYDQVHAHHS